MSKFAIGKQAERVAGGRRSAAAADALATVDESFGYDVATDGYGACSSFTAAKLTFSLARWGAA
jgi:hypothetical protein